MWYYFFGFLFIFLDFKLDLGYGGTLNCLPSFVGYLFLSVGSRRLSHENDHFRRLRLWSPILCVLSACEFVLSLLTIPLPKATVLVISILLTAASLYVTYEFAEGAKSIERSLYKKLEADKISTAWIILCMTALLEFLIYYFPSVALLCYFVHWLSIAWFASATYHFIRKLSGKEKN